MHAILNRLLQIAAAMLPLVAVAASAWADIVQWEYINPANPSQGKQQSTMLAPDGAGVDAVPGADLNYRNLNMAYLIGADLTGAFGQSANLTSADLSQANLKNANFANATLTDAEFTDADVRGTYFSTLFTESGTGITLSQLYSTASYQAHDLTGIVVLGTDCCHNNLVGANFAGQNLANSLLSGNLTGANFRQANLTKAGLGGTLTDGDFTGAEVQGARFSLSNLTPEQLYSTASYQARNLSGIDLAYNNLGDWDFAGQNLTYARFYRSGLTNADFTGADVRGANFVREPSNSRPPGFLGSGITLAQLYSTASYQAHDLNGIRVVYNDLAGGNFEGQNLTNASFSYAALSGANFRQANLTNAELLYADLTNADLTAADARGALDLDYADFMGATSANLIWPDGHIDGLDLNADSSLVVRDYDGDFSPIHLPHPPIPITIDQHLAMGPSGMLRMVFEADAWDSTISFAPGIPVALGGSLELTFSDDVNLATQIGRTFDLFDWTDVTPIGAFAIASPYAWDLSNLYTTGQVTLMAVPEPSSLSLGLALTALIAMARARLSFGSNTGENQ